MAVHTMEEATEGLTPHEIWVRRAVYHHARRILIDPSTGYEFGPRGYLERIEFSLGRVRYVLLANEDNGLIGDMLYLMFDEAARLVAFEEIQDAKAKTPRVTPILETAETLLSDKTIHVALTDIQWIDVLGELMSACSNQCTLAYWSPGTEDDLPRIAREAARTGDKQAWGEWFVYPDQSRAMCAIAEALGYWANWHEDEMVYVPYAPKR